MSEGDGHEFIDTFCSALRTGKRLKVIDKRGKIYRLEDFRILEVHAVGLTYNGSAPAARVFEVANFAIDPSESRWELLRLSNVLECKVTDEKSHAPRQGYRLDDPDMRQILCRI
ncbi:hypothetical protein [Mesorhizobium sophorae]|uniref:hypothetical protein n=1 Tax=Mesorhizobium sophorae TaxID=1300294 RepID=UPI000BA34B97|nr:hypothetical protein [Mesorhizobium sophorae]